MSGYTVTVPATSANLGSGFDCMGLALTLYNTFAAKPSDIFALSLSGAYTEDISPSPDNLLWKTMRRFWQETGGPEQTAALSIHSMIPPTRGLGSSSTAVAGGLLLANALSGTPLSRSDLLRMACKIEGHPDNVTPAFLGGVTLTVQEGDTILPKVLDAQPGFKVAVAVPDMLVETEKARAILPPAVSRADLVFNASRVGLLVHAFMCRDYTLLATATEDRVHQHYRSPLIPGMDEALRAALVHGAYGAVLSGSGPALLALCPEQAASSCAQAMQEALRHKGVGAVTEIVGIDGTGARVNREFE